MVGAPISHQGVPLGTGNVGASQCKLRAHGQGLLLEGRAQAQGTRGLGGAPGWKAHTITSVPVPVTASLPGVVSFKEDDALRPHSVSVPSRPLTLTPGQGSTVEWMGPGSGSQLGLRRGCWCWSWGRECHDIVHHRGRHSPGVARMHAHKQARFGVGLVSHLDPRLARRLAVHRISKPTARARLSCTQSV